ncbi:hypothetical protein OQZ33_22880 [Pedobacter sp. MC2016-05]|nr:hypothetical protein [Pedobacter sp. MC2016-05]MCX2477197.1 hypothetical protein [Pedobacter sp. MC2016-05]
MLKKINIGLVALILGFGLTITTSAFKTVNHRSKVDKQWNFRGNSVSEANDQTKYSLTLPSPTECGSDTDLPCYIITPESVDTEAKLHTYFMTNYGNNAALIDGAAPERRDAQ